MLNRRISIILTIFLFLSAGAAVYSQDAEDIIILDDEFIFDTEDIIIEDALIVEDPVIRPGQVTVFDRSSIEASGARTVADVIERAPGVIVSRQGGILEPQTVSIRGGESEHVLVLIDGKPAESLWSGSSDLSSISIQNVKRIEVIRGAGTAVYGEGAFSGVVNIITGEDELQAAADFEYGYASFNTHSAGADVSGPILEEAGLSGRLSAGGIYTGGGYTYVSESGESFRANNDGWRAAASGGLLWEPDSFELSVSGDFKASEKGLPGLMEFLTPDARSEEAAVGADILLSTEFSETWSFSADAGFSQTYSGYTNPDDNIADSNFVMGVSSGAESSGSFEAGELLIDVTASGGYSWNILDSTALTDSSGSAVDGTADQHTADLRLLFSMEWGRFDFTPAAAFDWSLSNYAGMEPDDDGAFSWSAAAGWSPFRTSIDEGPLYLKTNIGTSYKNPSFQDLFWPSGALASGNPDLEPEHGINLDAGVYLSFPEPKLSLEAVGFAGIAEDLIQWLPSAGGIWRPQNIGIVLNGGVEISAAYTVEGIFDLMNLELSASYSWLRAVDWDESSVNYLMQLAYRPEHSGSGGILILMPGVMSLGFDVNYLGLRFTNNSNTKYLDPVLVFSAALNFDLTEFFRISAAAENITNQQYVDRLGYPVPGFEWAFKGRVKL